MKRQRSWLWALWALLAMTLPAVAVDEPVAVVDETPALERALDTVDPDRLSADLHFIAADEMGGRDTPSQGQRIAARFIRNRLQRLGWEPAAPEGYFYEYELERNRLDAKGTQLIVETADGEKRTLKLGADYFLSPRGLSESEEAGPVVFCGNGERSDFESADVEGKWALVFDSDLSSRAVQVNARQAGALGVVFTPGPSDESALYSERYGRWVEQALEGRVSWPRDESADDDGGRRRRRGRRGGQTIYLGREAAASVFGWSSTDDVPEIGADLGVTFTDQRAMSTGERVTLENVCGFWPGSDPELKKQVMIVSAHYDHVGIAADGEVFNGADDNGSGTTGLLAIAEALVAYGPLKRSVMLIWVSGEEKGLLGSRAWAQDPWLPEGCEAACNLNIDMIGRNDPSELLITPTQDRPEYNGMVQMCEKYGELEGFETPFKSADAYWNRSDHANFAKLGIPVAFLFTDVHEDYHQTSDTPDKIDYDKMSRVVRLVVRMLDALQGMEKIG